MSLARLRGGQDAASEPGPAARPKPSCEIGCVPGAEDSLRVFPQIRSFLIDELNTACPRPTLYFSVYWEAEDRGLPHDWYRVSTWGAMKFIWRSPPQTLELYEPMWNVGAWLALALTYRARRLRNPGLIVFYAIQNKDPHNLAQHRLMWLRRRLVWARNASIGIVVSRCVDRIAFGTDAARETYERLMRLPVTATFPALRSPREVTSDKYPASVCFLAQVSDRKGISVLMQAWEKVEAEIPAARLSIIGDGPLASKAAAWSAAHEESRTFVGPLPRGEALLRLESASVLVLPSQRWPGWREQIGDAIIEALSVGCTIVASDETGIASWLQAHGHKVVHAEDQVGLAKALVAAINDPLPPATVIDSLPKEDGRITADAWLHAAPF